MKTTLKLMAPYIAVAIFWCVFSNAWLAILGYHAQILFWSWAKLPGLRMACRRRALLLALPAALAGPLLYFLLPVVTHVGLSQWLVSHHLSGVSLLMMIPYFGLIHPFLEQLHWSGLRGQTGWSHPCFAGYHVLVLYSLFTLPWLLICFAVLLAASFCWKQLERATQGLTVPIVSHALADLGVVLAAWARTH